jgi:endonuclease YncB( thermonuclease family)
MGTCISHEKDIDVARLIQLNNATYENTSEQVYKFMQAKVIKVYDGDTFWIAAWHGNEIQRFSVRLFGCDCAEIRTGTIETKRLAHEAKDYVISKIEGKIINIQVLNNTKFNGKIQREKYGRLLSIVHYNGINLADDLISKGYAKPYDGGTKNHGTK